jgi:8-oxo-dGTP diphosphatase
VSAKSAPAILAAGGVVWRPGPGGIELALVHRPRYGDWTFPKGKLDGDERALEAAVREVREETGAEVAVSRRLGTVRYQAADGPKRVTYWVMRWRRGNFVPNAEVDVLHWTPVADVAGLLSYDIDRSVLAEFTAVPLPDSLVVLVRHAKAGRRSDWDGPDEQRPLDPNGQQQARQLQALLSMFEPQRVHAADRVRCIDTVAPLATALGVPVLTDAVFNDESYSTAPAAARDALLALGKPGQVSVVCSQGEAIPGLIDQLGPRLRTTHTRKAAWWVISLADGEVLAADHSPPP